MIIKQHPIDELATLAAIFVSKIYQPHILKSHHGLGWWMIYFGNKNGARRGQFVNRVLFNDHELTVDGPTGSKTPGYHPDPALPIFGDNFETTDKTDVSIKWDIKSGKWQVQNNELQQADVSGKAVALIKSHKAGNYLFKVGVKNDLGKKGNTG